MRPRDPSKEKAIRRKAMEIAVKEGFDGLSMHKVARAAKVSAATLYVYFEDRDDLLIQVYLEESEKAFAAMMENFDPALPFALDTSGVVAAVRPPNEGEVCGSSYWYQLGWAPAPETMIDLTLVDGTALTIGLTVPGFSQSAVAEGDTLSIHYGAEGVGFGGRYALLEIKKEEALVAAIGENVPAGPTPSEGATECYSEDSLCGHRDITMDVPAPDGTIVSIPTGLDPARAFEIAQALAREQGWWVGSVNASTGVIEATTRSFWFGFTDDIVVRVLPDGSGSRIDMRSVSRVGRSDLGANAGRIRRFQAQLRERLQAAEGG